MKRLAASLALAFALLFGAGCQSSLDTQTVTAFDSWYSRMAPKYLEYVDADGVLSDTQKAIEKAEVAEGRKLLDELKKNLD